MTLVYRNDNAKYCIWYLDPRKRTGCSRPSRPSSQRRFLPYRYTQPLPCFENTNIDFVLDTAQIYRNELEAGQAIKESGLSRSDIFVTTKWSGMDGLDIPTSIDNSLKNVLDFYLGRITGHLLIAYMFFSLVYLTSIYILFTLRVLLSQT